MYRRFCSLFLNPNGKSPEQLRESAGKFAGAVGLFLNLLLSGAKIAVGWIFSNLAITADGFNNLTDASSSIITLVGFKLAGKPADKEHPYGHQRFEYLASLAISVIVLVLGINLGQASINKILTGEHAAFSAIGVAVMAASVAVKLWMKGFYSHLAKEIQSGTLKAAAADSFQDVIATSAVLLCIVISMLFDINLDGIISLGVSAFIIFSGAKMVKETADPLLGEAPDPELVRQVEARLSSYPDIEGFHDLIIHDYGPTRRFASVHIEMDAARDIMECHDLTDIIERDFAKQGLQLVVHLDPIVTGDAAVDAARAEVAALISQTDKRLSFHDFRMVIGIRHTNIIFDLVVPFSYSENEILLVKQTLCRQIRQCNPQYYAIIEIDRGEGNA